MQNFTAVDTLGTLKASLALLPFMVAPGYVAGWALDLFEFRQRRPILKLVVSIPLSIAICPMLSYALARVLTPLLWVFYLGVSTAAILLLAKEARRAKLWPISKHPFSRHVWVALGLISLWGAVALGSVVDLQIGEQLYPPIIAYDHSVRTAMTVEVARRIPPNNPFFANAAAPLRYHYLWLLFCSLPMRVLHLSPRHVVDSGVVWCGLGLMCVMALCLKFLIGAQSGIERKALLCSGLLCVTGLDVLPNLYIAVVGRFWLADAEKWNAPQIDSWISSLLWVPHHVAALIACFVAFLLLRHQVDSHHRWSTGPVIVAGMAFASAAGMSVYVTFTFVIAVALWLLALVTRKDWLQAAMFVAAGAVALVWALSFLSMFRGIAGPGGTAPGHAFVEFELRPFPLGIEVARRMGFSFATQSELLVANAFFLPFNYAMELGFFLAVGILRLRQIRHGNVEANENELAAWTLVATSFLIGTFLRSSTIATNDLGWRCFLPAQLILVLWGATLIHDWWFHDSNIASHTMPGWWSRGMLATLLIVGVISTAYQVFMLRMFPVLLDRDAIVGLSWVGADQRQEFGKRAYALRSAYEVLDAQLPPSAVLQSNPPTEDLILHMLYSGRDSAAGDGQCGTDFGGDEKICTLRLRRLDPLFEFSDGSDLDATCRAYGIDAVVVEDLDPVWRDPSSWVWAWRPDVANDFVRAFRCGAAADGVRP
jgi:hypothetical protein